MHFCHRTEIMCLCKTLDSTTEWFTSKSALWCLEDSYLDTEIFVSGHISEGSLISQTSDVHSLKAPKLHELATLSQWVTWASTDMNESTYSDCFQGLEKKDPKGAQNHGHIVHLHFDGNWVNSLSWGDDGQNITNRNIVRWYSFVNEYFCPIYTTQVV